MQTSDYLVKMMDTLEVLDPHNIIRLSIVKQIPRHYFAIILTAGDNCTKIGHHKLSTL